MYKFKIYKKNGKFEQHNKLCLYNYPYHRGVCSAYAAPLFVEYSELYKNASKSDVISNSFLFHPSIRLYSGSHFVRFDSIDGKQCCREEHKIERIDIRKVLNELPELSKEEFRSFVEAKIKETIEDSKKSLDENSAEKTQQESLEDINEDVRASYYMFF